MTYDTDLAHEAEAEVHPHQLALLAPEPPCPECDGKGWVAEDIADIDARPIIIPARCECNPRKTLDPFEPIAGGHLPGEHNPDGLAHWSEW